MAHDSNFPANDSFLADFPPKMREEIRAMINDAIVNALSVQGLKPGNGSGQIPVSNGNLCTGLNAEKLGGNFASAFATAGHTHTAATSSSNGLMSNTDKAKLDGIQTGAEVNQNAFSNVLVGGTTIQADGKTDTLEIVPGANIAFTPDAANDRLTIAVSGTIPKADNADIANSAGTANTLYNGVGDNDFIRVQGGSTGSNAGYLEIATADDGTEPIYVRQYVYAANNVFGNIVRTATLLNESGNTVFPGAVYANGGTQLATVNQIPTSLPANGGTSAACSGNAGTASKLATPRNISLTGAVTGNGSFDGSKDMSITTTLPSALPTLGAENYIANGLKITAGSGLVVTVSPGRASVSESLALLTAPTNITLSANKSSLICLKSDNTLITVDAVLPVSNVIPYGTISLGFVRTDGSKVVEIDDSSYKYGRREGITGGNRRVFLGWKYYNGSGPRLTWNNPFGTRKIRVQFNWAQDANGTNESITIPYYVDGKEDYGLKPTNHSSGAIGCRVYFEAYDLDDHYQLSGYIGCYAEVLE